MQCQRRASSLARAGLGQATTSKGLLCQTASLTPTALRQNRHASGPCHHGTWPFIYVSRRGSTMPTPLDRVREAALVQLWCSVEKQPRSSTTVEPQRCRSHHRCDSGARRSSGPVPRRPGLRPLRGAGHRTERRAVATARPTRSSAAGRRVRRGLLDGERTRYAP
eukprot:scaffold44_cov411-Prasinococcus_capsulatus_cf.AAC.23